MYTFDSELVSDLHKDAYGHRPSAEFMDMWYNGLSDEGRQAEWDYMVNAMKASMQEEAEEERVALQEFERELAAVMKSGNCNEQTALGYMTPIEFEDNEHLTSQDIEHWVWQAGILFTERGRQIVEMVKQIHNVR
jgi:hypothetical protein